MAGFMPMSWSFRVRLHAALICPKRGDYWRLPFET